MDLDTMPRGALIAGISGVALFIIMLLPWFGAGEAGQAIEQAQEIAEQIGAVEVEEVDTTANAWESFDFIDIVLLLTVIAAVGLAVMSAMGTSVNLPVAASAITTGIGVLATLLVLYRILDPPYDAGREYGVFLGLLACAGVAVGGWLAMQEEGTTFGGEFDQFGDRGGPGAPPPGGGAPPPPPPAGGTGAPPPPPPPTQ
jgi:hypothetical protein